MDASCSEACMLFFVLAEIKVTEFSSEEADMVVLRA
jgi:hypothetical protein